MTIVYVGDFGSFNGDAGGGGGFRCFHGDDIQAAGLVVPSQSSNYNGDFCSHLHSRVYPPQPDCPREALLTSLSHAPSLSSGKGPVLFFNRGSLLFIVSSSACTSLEAVPATSLVLC